MNRTCSILQCFCNSVGGNMSQEPKWVKPGISRVMDCAAKFPPLLPEIEMSYKHRFENKVY